MNMKTYKYKNYAEYVKCQVAANKRKASNQWAVEENIKAIAEWINNHNNPKHGLCHGVRQGWEVEWFSKYISGCLMMGTDIGKPVKKYIWQHDFNKQNPDWLHKFDFIYSNSFDHAYNPAETLKIWAEQLKPGGLLILEYDRRQEHTGEISMKINKTDPVSIRFDELQKLIPKWIKVNKIVVLDMPVVTQEWRKALIVEIA